MALEIIGGITHVPEIQARALDHRTYQCTKIIQPCFSFDFCAIDLWMLIPVYVLHQQHALSWNPSWTDLGLSLILMTTLLRTVFFWKHLIEETGVPTCVFSARGARPVRVRIILPGLDRAPQSRGWGLLEASLLPAWGEGWGTGSPRSLPGSHFQAKPPSWSPQGLCCRYIIPRARPWPRLGPFPGRCHSPA